MKTTKRCFCNFSFYDQEAIEKKLEDMAAKGWMLQKAGNFFWTYRRMEPKKLRFCVTYFPNASEFDPGPTEGELIKTEFCAQDGWMLALRWGVMQIYYHEKEDAIPIETDPVTQVETLYQAMKKSTIRTQICSAVLMVYYLVFQLFWLKDDPLDYLSSPLRLYMIPMFLSLLLVSVYEIVSCIRWHQKARRAAEERGVFLRIRSRRVIRWLLLAVSCLCLILAFSGFHSFLISFGLVWLCMLLLMIAAGNGIKQGLKKRGVSRRINLVVSAGSVALLTSLCLGFLTVGIIRGNLTLLGKKEPVGTYTCYGSSWEIYDDPLPLEIEDLSSDQGQWSKELEHQETVLLSRTECSQRALLTEDSDVKDLEYTITQVKLPFLYDFIKESAVNSRQDEVHEGFVFYDHYFPVDASPWQADSAYQLRWSDSVLNRYLICWEDRIVEINFFWEPTPEQIAVAAERLRTYASSAFS